MCNKERVFKVVLVGDSGVGKTSLMNQFVNYRFVNRYSATVGTDYMVKNLIISGESVTLQLWDTAGQERFQSLGSSFYRGTSCCVLVYDVTQPRTLASLPTWKEDFLDAADPKDPIGFPFAIIGNKIDLLECETDGVKYVKKRDEKDHRILTFLTSAKDAENVQTVFRTICENILQRELEMGYEIIRPDEFHRLHVNHIDQSNCCWF